jgi:hypothetical protein
MFSASQEIPPHVMEPDGSLPHLQVPTTCPHAPLSHFLKIHLNIILPSHIYAWFFKVVSFPQVSLQVVDVIFVIILESFRTKTEGRRTDFSASAFKPVR